MSKLIENIKRLATMVKGETKSGGNTAARVGGLFEDISDELELKYDRVDSDRIMQEHDTADGSHQNIQDAIEERIAGVSQDLTDVNSNLSKAIADGDKTLSDALTQTNSDLSKDIADGDKVLSDAMAEQNTNLSKTITDGDKVLADALAKTNTDLSKTIADGDSQLADAITQTNTNLSNAIAGTDASLKAHKDDAAIHQTSAQIRAEIVDANIPATLARVADVNTKDAATLAAAKQHTAEKIAEVLNGSPAALDTLFELAAALNNDPNFATTVMNAIGQKENAFSKNGAFNKDFGASANTVCQGNDARLSDARPASGGNADTVDGKHADAFQVAGNYAPGNHNHSGVYQPVGSYAPAAHGHTPAEVGAIPVGASCNKNWSYSGQSGQPTWLWGSTDGANMYVWNPSEFSVRYAATAGQASASDVWLWAKEPNKPSYSASEVGAAAIGHNHSGAYQPAGNYAASTHKHNASDVTEQTNKRFMTDAERTKVGLLGRLTDQRDFLGVVCAGSVSQLGQIGGDWGKAKFSSGRSFTVSRESVGAYRIVHNYGTGNYGIVAFPRFIGGFTMISSAYPETNSILILTYDTSGVPKDDYFWFILFKLD